MHSGSNITLEAVRPLGNSSKHAYDGVPKKINESGTHDTLGNHVEPIPGKDSHDADGLPHGGRRDDDLLVRIAISHKLGSILGKTLGIRHHEKNVPNGKHTIARPAHLVEQHTATST